MVCQAAAQVRQGDGAGEAGATYRKKSEPVIQRLLKRRASLQADGNLGLRCFNGTNLPQNTVLISPGFTATTAATMAST